MTLVPVIFAAGLALILARLAQQRRAEIAAVAKVKYPVTRSTNTSKEQF